jgi:hypothetical protein
MRFEARLTAIVVAALAAGTGVIAVVVGSDHQDAKAVWAIFGPAVGWSFIGTGLYTWRRRPETRIGVLMILLGFAWFLFTLDSANSPLVYTFALATFLLVTVARAGAGDAAWWPAFISTGLMPFAFLGGLLRSHVSHLDAERCAAVYCGIEGTGASRRGGSAEPF